MLLHLKALTYMSIGFAATHGKQVPKVDATIRYQTLYAVIVHKHTLVLETPDDVEKSCLVPLA